MENNNRYTITLDDDPSVCRLIARVTGIASLPYTTTAALRSRAPSFDPVALFVDVHLGTDDSGLDIIPELRSQWPYVPIIVVTSDLEDGLIGQALAAGANDFVRKPISPTELNGRLHARISEMRARASKDTISACDFQFYISKSALQKNDKTIYIPALEAQLLMTLLENRDMVVPKEEIKRRLWGKLAVSDNTLDKKLSCLRKALHDIGSSSSIKAIYGQGVLLQSHHYTAASA